MDNIIFDLIDILGVISFSISGTIVGMRRKLDWFGVIVISFITATGGGMMRDIFLGATPPAVFSNPHYAVMSTVIAAVFMAVTTRKRLLESKYMPQLNSFYLISDALGLGLYVVVGMNVGIANGHGDNGFLLVFLGVLTGVGGGVLRDILCGRVPQVLRSGELYASAGILGGIMYFALLDSDAPILINTMLTVSLIALVRMAGVSMRLELPTTSLNNAGKNKKP